MISFMMVSENGEISAQPNQPITEKGKFVILPNGDYVFSNMRDHRLLLEKYAKSIQMPFDDYFKLQRSYKMSGGHWLVENSTVVLYGYSQSFGSFDRVKANEMKDEIAKAFGLERVVIESEANYQDRYIY